MSFEEYELDGIRQQHRFYNVGFTAPHDGDTYRTQNLFQQPFTSRWLKKTLAFQT
jgi:hypothetical protein